MVRMGAEDTSSMKILIGTPAYGDTVTTTYCETLFWVFDHFRTNHPHIRLDHKFLSFSLLPYMRNYFASRVLNDASYTHLLFVDADMGFGPTLIEHMIAADKPVVGCIYPRRALDLNQVYALRDRVSDVNVAKLVAQDYVGAGTSIDFGEELDVGDQFDIEKMKVDGPAVRVKHAGTGVMLIKREVFEQIKARYPELWSEQTKGSYARLGLEGGVLQCFETMPDKNGIFVGEDVAFCNRWVEGCGGEIWSVVTETILHVGTDRFVGRFLTKLEHGMA
jgi:hypothetical protein